MARARNIKPGFFTNEDLVELPFETRILFVGLWTIADRAGRLEDRPKKIKLAIFPGDDVDVDQCLNELQSAGFLLRYTSAETGYIQVLEFCKHQNPHKDEKASSIPAPELHRVTKVQPQTNIDASLADSPIPDSLIPDSVSKTIVALRRETYPPEFEYAYGLFPARPGSSKKKAFAAWQARIKANATIDEITDGVKRYAAYIDAMKTEPQFIQMPATFFGPSENFRSTWAIPAQPRAGPTNYQTPNEKQKSFADRLTGKNNERDPDIIDIN